MSQTADSSWKRLTIVDKTLQKSNRCHNTKHSKILVNSPPQPRLVPRFGAPTPTASPPPPLPPSPCTSPPRCSTTIVNSRCHVFRKYSKACTTPSPAPPQPQPALHPRLGTPRPPQIYPTQDHPRRYYTAQFITSHFYLQETQLNSSSVPWSRFPSPMQAARSTYRSLFVPVMMSILPF